MLLGKKCFSTSHFSSTPHIFPFFSNCWADDKIATADTLVPWVLDYSVLLGAEPGKQDLLMSQVWAGKSGQWQQRHSEQRKVNQTLESCPSALLCSLPDNHEIPQTTQNAFQATKITTCVSFQHFAAYSPAFKDFTS